MSGPKTTPKTLPELWDQLNQHDWYYSYGEGDVYYKGSQEYERLMAAAGEIEGGRDLFRQFSASKFNKQPKPERPTE